jgi:hypothetical protein
LRASSTRPAAAIKGGDNPRSRRWLMYGLIATQVGFCFVIHFAADRLSELNGVESAAITDVPLLGGSTSNGFISMPGSLPSLVLSLLGVSPGWLQTMKIQLLEGRDLRQDATALGSAIVNLAFAKEYFHGEDPLGRSFTRGKQIYQVVGVVANAWN